MHSTAPDKAALREKWRLAQATARRLDVVMPRWWTLTGNMEGFLTPFNPTHRRMWEQLIRQRLGE